jgi:glycosyltransferase involved in cell wall biosynthesis
MISIFAFIPCHNRCKVTTAFISHLIAQVSLDCKLHIHVIDDGSTDNTGSHIKKNFPDCTIHKLNGKAFWGGAINYILNYIRNEIAPNENPLILIANDDIKFTELSLKHGIQLVQSNDVDVLIPVLIDMPIHMMDQRKYMRMGLVDLIKVQGIEVNPGDFYRPHKNSFSRIMTPGKTNVGVTAALLAHKSILASANDVPHGLPHYGSDFWLTHSLHCKKNRIATNEKYIVYRSKETTRPSSRQLGRWQYWKSCCNPSSPDYLPSSIIYQKKFSRSKYKIIELTILSLKFISFSILTSAKLNIATLEITWAKLLKELLTD